MPDGQPFVLEGHLLLILDEVFTTGRVEVLALLPKGNFKTTLFAALAVFHLLTVANANCYIGAADKIQAGEMYGFASHFAETDERVTGHLKVLRSRREIRSETDQGFIRVLASDDSRTGGKRQGFNPTLALIDELHAHDNPNLYVDMRSGLFKRGGILITITTAGHDEESVLGTLRKKFLAIDADGGEVRSGLKVDDAGKTRKNKDGRLTICRSASGRTVMLEWSCRPDDDLKDMATVKLANPASGVTIDSLEDALEAPGITPAMFARYRANVWVHGFNSWLPQGAWDKLAEPTLSIPEGAKVFAAIDMARYRDCAALVVVQPRDGIAAAVKKAGIWKSGGEEFPISYEAVKDAIRLLDRKYRLLACGFDPKYFDQAAEELRAEGIPMIKFDQSNERMSAASANLRQAILEGTLRHDGDEELVRHVIAGTTKDVGPNQWRLTKPKKGHPIDGVVALAMAHQLAFFQPQKKPSIEVLT